MAFILFGTKLSDEKKVNFALSKIFGIGSKQGKAICWELGITPQTKVNRLEPQQQFDMAKKMKEDHIVSGHLEEFIKRDINRLKEINSRRGYRLRHGLPTRGQRTHSNGKTIRRAKFLKLKN